MAATVTPPLKWHGGKHYLTKHVIGMMPPHLHYVEPFAGGLQVLLAKDPTGISEVVNDLHGGLTTFWRVLQDVGQFARFQRIVEAVPFSQVEFRDAAQADTSDPVDVAVRFFIRCRQSRQGLCRDYATMSRTRTRRSMNEQASSWLSAVDGLAEVHARLRRVVIFNDDALRVIRQQGGPDTLFYCDPPYVHETRSTTGEYHHEMTVEQHAELLDALAGIEGKFLLSGYACDLYDRWAAHHGFECQRFAIDNKASSAKTKAQRTECVWSNYMPTIPRG